MSYAADLNDLIDGTSKAVRMSPQEEAAWREVRQTVDEELNRLPEKYRVPFVLFYLEGRSSAEVAGELGCPVGTVESWLTRARAARSKFADRFYIGVRDGCTAEQRREAERRAGLSLGVEEAAT